jgi:putative Mg2+ transporter-C (MgtC) family protein
METGLMEICSLLIATILGAVVGLEREISHKAAGLRTNILICLGACVFTLVSKNMGMLFNASATRIAAHVVGGVGFLGAGAIIQDRGGVQGITTAATIWLVASVGISCGAGFYLLAVLATITTTATLLGFKPLERKLKKKTSDKNKTETGEQNPIN